MMKTNPLGTVVDLHLQVVEPCDSSAVWQVCLIMPKKDGISCVAEKKKHQAIGYGTYLLISVPFGLALRQIFQRLTPHQAQRTTSPLGLKTENLI